MITVNEANICKKECIEEDDVDFIDFSINADDFANVGRGSFQSSQMISNVDSCFNSKTNDRTMNQIGTVRGSSTIGSTIPIQKLPCPNCHLKFDCKEKLNCHVTENHPDAYICRKCSQWCEDYASLNRHHLKFHVSLYTCEKCGRCFKDEGSLQNHIIFRHGPEQEKLLGKIEVNKGNNKVNLSETTSLKTDQISTSPLTNPAVVQASTTQNIEPVNTQTGLASDSNPNKLVFYVILPPGMALNPDSNNLLNSQMYPVQMVNSQPVQVPDAAIPSSLLPGNSVNSYDAFSEKSAENLHDVKQEEESDDDIEIIESSPLEYYCVKCKMKFQHKSRFDFHMELHYNSVNHGCDKCTKSFKQFNDYLNHPCVKRNKQTMCTQCGRYFSTVSRMRRHMAFHAPNCSNTSATIAGANYFQISQDEDNIQIGENPGIEECIAASQVSPKTRTKTYDCSKCGCAFTCYMTMRRHVKKCDVTIFTCPTCRRFYRQKSKLQRHLKLYHGPQSDLECTVCKREFKTKLTLYRHQLQHNSHDSYRCPTCLKIFRLRQNYDYHMQTAHRGRPYKCDVCNALLTSITHVKSHFTKKHKSCDLYYSMNDSENIMNTGINPSEKNNSVVTGQPLNSQIVANIISNISVKTEYDEKSNNFSTSHIQREPQILCSYSVHNKQNRYSCHLCTQTFQFKHRLKYHILNLHNSSRPVKCGSCSKYFQTIKRFGQHVCSGSVPKFKVFTN